MQTLVSNLPWCLLTSILPEKSTFFRFQTQPMCADRPVSLLNINICMSKTLHIFKWFAKWKLCELMLDSCFIPKPLKQPSFHFMNVFFCFCSQTLFVLRPLIAWKPHSGKIFSDIVMCLLAKSQELIVEADCSDGGTQIICISKLWKKRFRKAWRRRKWLAHSTNNCEQLKEHFTQTMKILCNPVWFTDLLGLQWNTKGDHSI